MQPCAARVATCSGDRRRKSDRQHCKRRVGAAQRAAAVVDSGGGRSARRQRHDAAALSPCGPPIASPGPGRGHDAPGLGLGSRSEAASAPPAAVTGVRAALDAASPGPGRGAGASDLGLGHEAAAQPPVAALGVRTALLDAYAAAARLLGGLPDISQVRVPEADSPFRFGKAAAARNRHEFTGNRCVSTWCGCLGACWIVCRCNFHV